MLVAVVVLVLPNDGVWRHARWSRTSALLVVVLVDVALAVDPRQLRDRARPAAGHRAARPRRAHLAGPEPDRSHAAGGAGRRPGPLAARVHATAARHGAGRRDAAHHRLAATEPAGPLRDPRTGRPRRGSARHRRAPAAPGGPRPAPRPPGLPEPGGGGAAHHPGAHPRGRPAVGQGSRRRHRVRPAARVRRGRRGPAHRLGRHRPRRQGDGPHVPRRAEPERAAAARQRSRDGGAGGRRPAGRARHGRAHVPHHRRHPPRRPLRSRRLRPHRARGPPGPVGPRPARSRGRGDVRPRAGAGRERLPGRVHPRAGAVPPAVDDRAVHRPRGAGGGGVAAAGAARCSSATTSSSSPRCAIPTSSRWATASPADASEAYRSTAATLALAERDRAIARLRGMGAIVIDAPPGQLAPQLADTYLELKASGGL